MELFRSLDIRSSGRRLEDEIRDNVRLGLGTRMGHHWKRSSHGVSCPDSRSTVISKISNLFPASHFLNFLLEAKFFNNIFDQY